MFSHVHNTKKNNFFPFDYKFNKKHRFNKKPIYNYKKKVYTLNKLFPDILINWYQKNISTIRESNCPFYPSCSNYGRQAFRKYGFIKGVMLTSDRLLRCNGYDLKKYKFKKGEFSWLRYDPVP